jgi:CRISPR-associated protein Csx10
MTLIRYTVTLEEPVLVTAPGGDPNTDESLNYLPGSVIRGALATRYQGTRDTRFTRLFLDGTTRYLNAYIVDNAQNRALPTPFHYVQAKEVTDPVADQPIFNTLRDKLSVQTSKIGSFATMSGDYLNSIRVHYEIAVHTARERKEGRAMPKGDNSALFRYKALAAGQTFAGLILVDEAEATLLRDLLDEASLWLGGSSSAGYGRVRVALDRDEAAPARELDAPVQAIPAHTPFTLWLTADAILRHPQTGQPGPYLKEALEARWPGCVITIKESSHQLAWVGGFNNHWRLPLPQTWAVSKGSAWQLTASRPLSVQDITDLEHHGLGERRAEGFGSLLINPSWEAQHLLSPGKATREKMNVMKPARATLTFPPLEGDAAALTQQMNERLARQELDRLLKIAVREKTERYRGRLSNSQIARLRLRIREEMNQPDQQFHNFQAYLKDTEARKSADVPFRKSRLGNQNFRDWLRQLTENPHQVWQELHLEKHNWQKQEEATAEKETVSQWRRTLLGQDSFHLTAAMAHTYTTLLIAGICEQLAARGRNTHA